jgi:preprotein translocase subunit YajC
MENLKVNDEVIYSGYYATVKEIAEYTVLISCPLFSNNVWVPISQIKIISDHVK